MEAYFEAKMRLFEDVLEPGAAAVVWTDDAKSDEVIARCMARGLKVLTVGAKGETLKLLKRETTQLGQKLTIEAGRQDPCRHPRPDRRLSGGERADRGGPGDRDRRRRRRGRWPISPGSIRCAGGWSGR